MKLQLCMSIERVANMTTCQLGENESVCCFLQNKENKNLFCFLMEKVQAVKTHCLFIQLDGECVEHIFVCVCVCVCVCKGHVNEQQSAEATDPHDCQTQSVRNRGGRGYWTLQRWLTHPVICQKRLVGKIQPQSALKPLVHTDNGDLYFLSCYSRADGTTVG